jgi:tetratricopeptide (TPR) repeat protein
MKKWKMGLGILLWIFLSSEKCMCQQNVSLKADTSSYENGVRRLNEKDYKGAVALFSKHISTFPDSPDAYYYRGRAKAALWDNRGAIQDFNRAIELKPDSNAEAYFCRALCKQLLRDLQGEMEDYTSAIRINPNHAAAYYFRGTGRILQLKQKELGCLDLSKAGELGYPQAYDDISGIVSSNYRQSLMLPNCCNCHDDF